MPITDSCSYIYIYIKKRAWIFPILFPLSAYLTLYLGKNLFHYQNCINVKMYKAQNRRKCQRKWRPILDIPPYVQRDAFVCHWPGFCCEHPLAKITCTKSFKRISKCQSIIHFRFLHKHAKQPGIQLTSS